MVTQNKSDQRQVLRVGSVIEWYGYTLYGTAATLVSAHLFFPNADPVICTIVLVGNFAIACVARPIGGFVAGHFGDGTYDGRITLSHRSCSSFGSPGSE